MITFYTEYREKILTAIMERDDVKLREYHEKLRLYIQKADLGNGYTEGYCMALSLMCLDALDKIYKERLK